MERRGVRSCSDQVHGKVNGVIAITETGCDMGYFGKSRVAARFGITCQAVKFDTGLFDIIFDTGGLCLSCDTAGHGKGCKMVSSSFRCLAVYMILAM